MALSDAGPWAVVVALGIAVFTVLVIGLQKQAYVPGWLYREEREARKVSDATAAATAKALLSMTREFRELRRDVQANAAKLDAMRLDKRDA